MEPGLGSTGLGCDPVRVIRRAEFLGTSWDEYSWPKCRGGGREWDGRVKLVLTQGS